MKSLRLVVAMTMIPALLGLAAGVYAAKNFNVDPSRFDPAHTFLVQATWLDGIGCPTDARVATYPATHPTGTYTDPACPTGDRDDQHNQGLLLAKTGPTSNNAAAQAVIKGVSGTTLTELGYDIRKPGSTADLRGSHCGAGAPRFDIETEDGNTYFIGCNSPPPAQTPPGSTSWLRLRWTTAFPAAGGVPVPIAGLKVKTLAIVMDEGQDTGPDNFGLAVLDNIDVNGTLVGHGPQGHDTDGGGKGKGHDNNDDQSGNGNGND
jgi:hypothetical protein